MSIAWLVVIIIASSCIADVLFLTLYCHFLNWDKYDYLPPVLGVGMGVLLILIIALLVSIINAI